MGRSKKMTDAEFNAFLQSTRTAGANEAAYMDSVSKATKEANLAGTTQGIRFMPEGLKKPAAEVEARDIANKKNAIESRKDREARLQKQQEEASLMRKRTILKSRLKDLEDYEGKTEGVAGTGISIRGTEVLPFFRDEKPTEEAETYESVSAQIEEIDRQLGTSLGMNSPQESPSKQESPVKSVDISEAYPNQTPASLATGFVTYRNGRSIDEIVSVMQAKRMSEQQIQAVLDEIARLEDAEANK